ncbi:hypothetical protein EYZ11_000182 [Aspergillus tanneri]|nr:hypothetical protein EYZ11_000182 [Aspergillus tanneri]
MADIRTIVKCAISWSASTFDMVEQPPRIRGGLQLLPPAHIRERLKTEHSRQGTSSAGGNGDMLPASWAAAEDALTGVTKALIIKIAAMMMLERDEVRADAPIASFRLDSLVSVELRNRVLRETSAQLALGITYAESLRALATRILLQRELGQKA